jgi:hypothetical protein
MKMPNATPLTDAQLKAVRENYKDIARTCEVGVPSCRDCTIRALLTTVDARDRMIAVYREFRFAETPEELFAAANVLEGLDPEPIARGEHAKETG